MTEFKEHQVKKTEIRAWARQRRLDIHEQKGMKVGAQMRDHFLDVFSLTLDHTVAAYFPFDTEPNIMPLVNALLREGVPVALPVVVKPSAPLAFKLYSQSARLVKNQYGISQPAADSPTVIPTHILVPALAFDKTGHRLGYGGGYYDRTLELLKSAFDVLAIGVCYEDLCVERVPVREHDMEVDYILTEERCEKVKK